MSVLNHFSDNTFCTVCDVYKISKYGSTAVSPLNPQSKTGNALRLSATLFPCCQNINKMKPERKPLLFVGLLLLLVFRLLFYIFPFSARQLESGHYSWNVVSVFEAFYDRSLPLSLLPMIEWNKRRRMKGINWTCFDGWVIPNKTFNKFLV